MAMILHCRDAGFDCDAVVSGESPDEILAQVRPHASSTHLLQMTPPLERTLLTLIQRS